MRDMAVGQTGLPVIPGYEVYQGRRRLHARYRGTAAQAHREGRPWHVVGRDVGELLAEIQASTMTPLQREAVVTTRGLPDGAAPAILLDHLRTELRWWLPQLRVFVIQPDLPGHDPVLRLTTGRRDATILINPAGNSYHWRGTGELVGTTDHMTHTIQQIAQHMGVI